MSYAVLAAELALPAYAGLSDQAAADAVNGLTVTRPRLVPCGEVKKHAIEHGYWPAIIIASEVGNAHVAVRGLALCARDWIDDVSGKIENLDFSLQSTQSLIAALVAAGIVAQEHADSLAALSNETVPWTVANGMPEIGIGLVINARKA